MQFINTFFFAAMALASMVTANQVHFVNQDSTTRSIMFTGQENMESPETAVIPGMATANVTFPTGWIGNFYSVSDGAPNVPGMLGELSFDGYGGATFFDVSAIVNPDDHSGVKMLFPMTSDTPVSGCQTFPCADAYNLWDDIQTQSTPDNELICLLGNLSNERRRGARMAA